MTLAEALIHAVIQAFNSVASRANLGWEVKKRILKQGQRSVLAYAYTNAEDFGV